MYHALSMMAAKNHDDYTVGWICALPLEMAAAQVLLDDRYAPAMANGSLSFLGTPRLVKWVLRERRCKYNYTIPYPHPSYSFEPRS